MPLIQWTDRLSVGVKKFDEQHKQLVAMINELQDAMLAAKGKGAASKILLKLTDYVAVHFREEERAMDDAGYPAVAEHKLEHRKLAAEVQQYVKRAQAKDLMVTVGLMNFLRDWLINHIQKTDMQYSGVLGATTVR
jgi:hemerythrin